MIIQIPYKFELPAVLPFIQTLESNEIIQEDIYFDFSGLSFAYPFSTLVIGAGIRRFVTKRLFNNLNTYITGLDSRSAHSYLAHVGFFKYLHWDIGNELGRARGSFTYIPITKLERSTLNSMVSSPYVELRHVILEESRRIARLFSNNISDDNLNDSLAYPIREIIRNVFEHSASNECYLFGQRWSDGSVELGIVDEGIGIKSSLSQSFPIDSDEEAIDLAIQPGITRVNVSGTSNLYDNSGFGLYILSRLGNDFGWFVIGSGNSIIAHKNDNRFVANTKLHGTTVGLHLTRTPTNFSQILSQIIHDGEVEAHTMGRVVTASSSSRISF